MLDSIKETINPKGGHGLKETLIFLVLFVLIIGVLVLNYLGVEIDHSLTAGLSAIIGWIVGSNSGGNQSDDIDD